jgi:uncharacterized damage-inducible protein DinB
MHPSVAPLHRTLRLNTRLYLNCLEGVDDQAARRRPNEHTNSLAFVALHLVDSRHFLARLLSAPAENPFAALLDSVRGIDELGETPPLPPIRAAWIEVSAVLERRLEALTGAELAREPGQNFLPDDPTLLGAVTFLAQHDGYHVGQMALLRKFLGLNAMSYA